MAGILPFGAVFIELFFIFTAIWENQFYYLFGFLFLVFIILIISCSQISIVMVYFQLCGEVKDIKKNSVGCNYFILGLPLVVAQLHSFRRLSPLYSRIFSFLFRHKTRHNRIYPNIIIHWLHWTDGFNVLVINRNDWIFRCLCFRSKDLFSSQNRLK